MKRQLINKYLCSDVCDMLIKRKVMFGYKHFLKDTIRQVINKKFEFNVYNYKIVCVECSFIIYKAAIIYEVILFQIYLRFN